MTDSKREKKAPRTIYMVKYRSDETRFFAEAKDAAAFKQAVDDEEADRWFGDTRKMISRDEYHDARLYQEVSRTDAKAIAEHPPEILLVSEYRAGSEFSYMPIPAELRPEYLAEIVENGRLSYKVLRAASYYCAEPQKCFLVQPVRPEDLVESRRTFLCSEIYHKDSLYPLPNVAFAKKTLAFVLRGDESAIAPEDIRTLYDSLCPDGNDRGCEERTSIQEEELY